MFVNYSKLLCDVSTLQLMLLSVLKDPMPRALYDYVVKSSKLSAIMEW